MGVINTYLSEPENASREYCAIREKMGQKDLTDLDWDVITKTAGFLLMYCPNDMSIQVQASINEIGQRRHMLAMLELDKYINQEA